MAPEFREARRDEVLQIVALLADDDLGRQRERGAAEGYLAAFDAMHAEAGNRLYVAIENGTIVACYQLTVISGLSLAAARRAQIEGVRVARDRRGAGLGALLLEDAEARARAAGCSLLQLTSNAVREDARRFYERAGFAASHVGFKKPLD